MALTPNPFVNITSADAPLGSMRMFQGFQAVNPTTGFNSSQSYAWGVVPNIASNAAAINNMLGNASLPAFANVTWYLVSLGFHSIWASNALGLPTTVNPPGTTLFTKIYSDGNDLYSAGDFSAGGSLSF